MNILFVCTGNTCRSPMAAALLKEKYPSALVKSAGIFARENDPASAQAITVMKEKNIVLDHNAQIVNEQLLEWAELVLTMTEGHKQLLQNYFPNYQEKYFTLVEYTGSEQDATRDIADPFGGSVAEYRKTAQQIEAYLDLLIKKVQS